MQQTVNQPTTNGPKQPSGRTPRQLLSTRRGMLGVALLVAFFGAGAILVFLQQYRNSVDEETRPIKVLVANGPIGKGTAGDIVASEGLFQVTEIVESEAKDGAITDPGTLRGRVAAKEIFPGEQLTSGAFVVGSRTINSKLTGSDRAISVPVDNAHGLVGQLRTGDHVDILAGFTVERGDGRPRPVMRVLVQDALVLHAEGKSASGRSAGNRSQVVVRGDDRQAQAIAFAADNGKVWVTLRPPSRAEQTRPGLVTLESLLVGLKPISIDRRGRR